MPPDLEAFEPPALFFLLRASFVGGGLLADDEDDAGEAARAEPSGDALRAGEGLRASDKLASISHPRRLIC